jgi:hypothetical protein
MLNSGLLEVKINQAELRDLSSFYKKSYEASAKAASESIKETTAVILLKGRLNIQGSGPFSGPWLKGLQSRQYPKGKNSPNAKSYINHRLGGLASVFEFGASIRPKRGRYLWLLAPGAPKRMRLGADFGKGWLKRVRGPTTPSRLNQAAGKLVYLRSKRGTPMLGISVGKGKRARFKPYFLGIPLAKIGKRWSIIPICEAEGDKLVPRFITAFDKATR